MRARMGILAGLTTSVVLALGTAITANADIVYIGPRVIQPSGQGVVPTVLTLQENGPNRLRDGIESGAIRRVDGKDVREGDAKPGINSSET